MRDEACPREELLAAYAAQDLSPAEERSLEEHLKSCSICSEALDGNRSVSQALRALPLPAPSREARDRAYAAVMAAMEAEAANSTPASGSGKGSAPVPELKMLAPARPKARSSWIVGLTGALAAACLFLIADLTLRDTSSREKPSIAYRDGAGRQAPEPAKPAVPTDSPAETKARELFAAKNDKAERTDLAAAEHAESADKGDSATNLEKRTDPRKESYGERFGATSPDRKPTPPGEETRLPGENMAEGEKETVAKPVPERSAPAAPPKPAEAPPAKKPSQEPAAPKPASASADRDIARRAAVAEAAGKLLEADVKTELAKAERENAARARMGGASRPKSSAGASPPSADPGAGASPDSPKMDGEKKADADNKKKQEKPAKDDSGDEERSKIAAKDATEGAAAPKRAAPGAPSRDKAKEAAPGEAGKDAPAEAQEAARALRGADVDATLDFRQGGHSLHIREDGSITLGPEDAPKAEAEGFKGRGAGTVADITSLSVVARPDDPVAQSLARAALDQLCASSAGERDLRWAKRVVALARFLKIPGTDASLERMKRIEPGKAEPTPAQGPQAK